MSCCVQNSEGGDTSDSSIEWQAGSLGSISIRTSTRANVSTCKPRDIENVQPFSAKSIHIHQTYWHRHTQNNTNTFANIHTLWLTRTSASGGVSALQGFVLLPKRDTSTREIRRGETGRELKIAEKAERNAEWSGGKSVLGTKNDNVLVCTLGQSVLNNS